MAVGQPVIATPAVLHGTSVQPFDAKSGQAAGEVFPVAEGVSFTSVNNFAPVTVSGNGLLLYGTGGSFGNSRQAEPVVEGLDSKALAGESQPVHRIA